MMLLPYKSRHLLRKKSVFFARTGRSVIQLYNKLAAVYWLPMFWPRRRPGTHGTHFASMSGPTVHPYTVLLRYYGLALLHLFKYIHFNYATMLLRFSFVSYIYSNMFISTTLLRYCGLALLHLFRYIHFNYSTTLLRFSFVTLI